MTARSLSIACKNSCQSSMGNIERDFGWDRERGRVDRLKTGVSCEDRGQSFRRKAGSALGHLVVSSYLLNGTETYVWNIG